MSQSARRFEITRNVALSRAEVWELLANTDRLDYFGRTVNLAALAGRPQLLEKIGIVAKPRAPRKKSTAPPIP